jgi:uncharacterized protein YggE
MMMMRQSAAAMESAQPPIAPGELEVRANVTLTMALR